MELESIKVVINQDSTYIYDKIIEVSTFEKLMPENKSKFEVTGADTFMFALQGMPEITLKLKDKTPNSVVLYESANPKMEFELTVNIRSISNEQCEVFYKFEGKFNAMISMMIKGPISKFIETLALQTQKL